MRHCDSECMGNYDFNQIAYYTKTRFIDGCDTIALLAELLAFAKTEREREEIALVSTLELENGRIKGLQVRCRYAGQCKDDAGQSRTSDCIKKLEKMLEQ